VTNIDKIKNEGNLMKKQKSIEQTEPSRPIRYLNHNALPVEGKGVSLLKAALNYLQDNAAYYHLKKRDIKNMVSKLEREFSDEKSSFRLEVQKDFMDTITFVFVQTYFGLPVWEAGVSVTMDKKRRRILSSSSSAYDEIRVSTLGKSILSKDIETASMSRNLGLEGEIKGKENEVKIQSERLLIYKYEAKKRTISPLPDNQEKENILQYRDEFILPLPPVPGSIKEGNFYIVKEVIFHYPLPSAPKLLWRAFVEPKTGAVLFFRAFGSNVAGMVFLRDPITSGSGLTPKASNADLTAIRDRVTLVNLDPPSASGVQSLTGSLVSVQEVESPTIAAPTKNSPYKFKYNARTNNFAAVNAYFHCNGFLQLILDMGFKKSYFNGTVFPVPCDHRGLNQPNTAETTTNLILNAINAHCLGNSTGITSVDFALADVSDITLPVTSTQITSDHLGIACDVRVVLHEIAGHGVLYCHVGGANFNFAHSAGDSVAVILNDPGSQARRRFESFPFSFLSLPPSSRRRHNRTPRKGWGWAGKIALNPFDPSLDLGGYNNEQILSTTLFRLYRSMGGDSTDIKVQHFASRFAVYLILKALSTLSSTTNPANALAFEKAMEDADATDWHSKHPHETQAGGAYMKVIRWAFEKQGLFQIPGTATPNNNIGDPPAVDAYIDDGRHGEYDYQPNHGSCQDIWNRTDLTMGDGGGVHQEPMVGRTNYAFVRIKNRGYRAARNIVVRGFHCLPGVGLVYPNDWIAMATPQLTAPDLAANNSFRSDLFKLTNIGEIVGPFEWVPSQLGHECMAFTVSAKGDPCNIDGRVTGPIPAWRLVPHDNNIGQRNVYPTPLQTQPVKFP
jgi:hypothetical protein